MLTEKEYYESLSEDFKRDCQLHLDNKLDLLTFAKRYGLTYKEHGRTYVKATLINAITSYKKFNN